MQLPIDWIFWCIILTSLLTVEFIFWKLRFFCLKQWHQLLAGILRKKFLKGNSLTMTSSSQNSGSQNLVNTSSESTPTLKAELWPIVFNSFTWTDYLNWFPQRFRNPQPFQHTLISTLEPPKLRMIPAFLYLYILIGCLIFQDFSFFSQLFSIFPQCRYHPEIFIVHSLCFQLDLTTHHCQIR